MKKKLVTINTAGPIKELAGSIWGPVLTPTNISVDTIYKMLSSGKKVYEVNPKNRKQTIPLNKENYKRDNFGLDKEDIVPKLVEEEQKREAARLEAVRAQEEADRIAKENAEKAAAIVQEEDPDVIPVHTSIPEPVAEETTVIDEEPVVEKEPSAVEGFDLSRNNNKKNKKHGDFRK